jgi:DNA-binding ferritin-like protein (Dps family)
MNSYLKKIIGDKRAWNMMEARAKTLPGDYHIVFDEIKEYMWNLWRFSASAGDMEKSRTTLEDLLNLFETGAKEGKGVLEVTGKDVAAFCDDLFHATETWRSKLNADIMKKLGEKGEAPTA